jgi:excisionase family DNA binding protein
MKALISIADFQEMFGVSRSTVYRIAAEGQISFVHIGRAVRIRCEDAEKWAANLPCSPAKPN